MADFLLRSPEQVAALGHPGYPKLSETNGAGAARSGDRATWNNPTGEKERKVQGSVWRVGGMRRSSHVDEKEVTVVHTDPHTYLEPFPG